MGMLRRDARAVLDVQPVLAHHARVKLDYLSRDQGVTE